MRIKLEMNNIRALDLQNVQSTDNTALLDQENDVILRWALFKSAIILRQNKSNWS